MFSDQFLEQIRDANDIETVVSSYVQLKRRGKNLAGLCPFHNEKTPSFTVYPETSSYFCFGCGAGGDVITFIRAIQNLDYVEAVKYLADRSGISMPTDNYDDSSARLRRRIYEANREAAKFYHETLYSPKGVQQLQYLTKRGLTKNQITHFGLGAAPDEWRALCDHLTGKGFSVSELLAANLVRQSEKNGKKYYYDSFRAKVMFPVIDVRGNVIAFGGRVLDNSKPKYINTADTLVYKKSNELFALNFAKNSNDRKLILCEGYMDVISLHGAGFTNAVAGCGTALTPNQVNLISRYADEVMLCYDSDEAGKKAVRAAMALFSKSGVNVKVIKLDGGKDPDEIIRTYGKERFRNLLEKANNDMEYKLSGIREKYDIDSDDGKINYLRAASKLLAASDPLEREVYAGRLSDELGIGKASIMMQIDTERKKLNYNKKKMQLSEAQKEKTEFEKAVDPARVGNMRAAKAEDIILTTLLANGSFYQKLKNSLSADLFVTPVNKRIFEVISSRIENSLSTDISVLSAELTSDELGAVARHLANSAIISNSVSECEDCIKVLEEEKSKKSASAPSNMNDDEFLAYFASFKKED